MLFGKPKLAPEERRARIEEIEALISADKSAEAYAKARELEKLDSAAAALSMAYFSLMGENVREDASAAARYAEKYARSTPDDARGWRRLGYAQMTQRNFADAAEALEKAYRLGDTESGVMLAAACKILADGLRNEAAGTLNVAAFGKANGQAMTLYTQACALCEKIGSEQPGLMDDADWQGYGRSFDMMYALSLNGETKSFRVTDKALLDYLSVTQAFDGGKKDAVSHAYWLAVAVRGCSLMDKAGYRAMAEYFRAALCLDACDAKKGEMLANAKWHLDRASELASTLTAEQRGSYPDDFADYRELYAKMQRKYGRAMEAALKKGQLPDLSGEYPAGQAPAADSCALFMQGVAAVQSGAPAPGEAPKKKGFFGLFG